MSVRSYVITVDDQAGISIADVANQLRDAGFDVSQQLDAIGVIVGRADEAELPRIRRVPGVAAIEEDRTGLIPL